MNPPINAVLFDLDGTLLDTARDLLFVINLSLRQHNKPLQTYDSFRQHISGGIDAMISHAFNIDAEHHEFESIKNQCLNDYDRYLATHTCFFEGVEDVLDYLDAHHIPWGIVTNKATRFTLPLLKALTLNERAQCVVTADTLEHMKPHPAPMRHACQLLNQKPENTLYVGDFKTDVTASRAANMPCLIVTYGYYPAHMNPHEWGADKTVEQARDIILHLNTYHRNAYDHSTGNR